MKKNELRLFVFFVILFSSLNTVACSEAFKLFFETGLETQYYSTHKSSELTDRIDGLKKEKREVDSEIRKLEDITKPPVTYGGYGMYGNTFPLYGSFSGYSFDKKDKKGKKATKKEAPKPKAKELTPEQKEKLEKLKIAKEEIVEEMDKLNDEFSRHIEQYEKPAVLKRINKLTKKSERNKELQTEYLLMAHLKNIKKDGVKFISLVFEVGNDKVANIQDHVKSVIKEYSKEENVAFIYDADTSMSKFIQNQTAGRSIGLSATRQDVKNNVFKIRNVHLKLSLYKLAEEVFTDNYSLSGFGLQFMSGSLSKVNVYTAKQVTTPQVWIEKSKSAGLGLKDLGVAYNSTFFPKITNFKKASAIDALASEINLSRLDFFELLELENDIKWHIRGELLTSGIEGSAIFGSSKDREDYGEFTYNLAFELGKYNQAVVTGGSGGMMLAANMGSFHAGSNSVGVPVAHSGKLNLKNEKDAHTSFHSNTIFASGYDNRIPYLINKRENIIFVPGGSGTVRELAATLVYLENLTRSSQQLPRLIFASPGNTYYQSLIKVFKSHQGTSKIYKDHLFWIASVRDIHSILPSSTKDGNFSHKNKLGVLKDYYAEQRRIEAERKANIDMDYYDY